MLSVIVTSYNYARYLPAALSALAGQTRPPDELIVIDDHSQDDSVKVINAFLDRFPAARLVQNTRNLGTVPNLNRGLQLARGDIVFFAAADDIAYPALLATGLELLDAYPEAGLFSARTDIIAADSKPQGLFPTAVPLDRAGFLEPGAVRRILMHDDTWLTGNTTLYRRAKLIAAGGFPEELGSFADGYVSRLLAVRHGACYTPEVLGAWRRHSGGLAWAETVDFERARSLAAAARSRMEAASGQFPRGYGRRWSRRYLYGARRFALARKREAARDRGPGTIAGARLYEIVTSFVLFIAYRPWDIFAVLRRRLSLWRSRSS